MAIIEGIHLLAHGDKAEARHIAQDIAHHNRLLIGTNSFFGAGAYAWYTDRLPIHERAAPQVLFTIDEDRIIAVYTRAGVALGFFRIPGAIGSYVDIHVQRFVNLD